MRNCFEADLVVKRRAPAEVFKVALNVAAAFVQIRGCRTHYVLNDSLTIDEARKMGRTSLTRTSLSLLSSFGEE